MLHTYVMNLTISIGLAMFYSYFAKYYIIKRRGNKRLCRCEEMIDLIYSQEEEFIC